MQEPMQIESMRAHSAPEIQEAAFYPGIVGSCEAEFNGVHSTTPPSRSKQTDNADQTQR